MGHPEHVSLDRYRRAVAACAVMNLRQASRVVTAFFDEALRPSGLRATQLNILMAIEVGGPPTVTGLSEILAMERTTLTRNLRILRNRGLVVTNAIDLTPKGRHTAAVAMPMWERAQTVVVDSLGTDRWQALLAELAATKNAVRQRRRRENEAKRHTAARGV